MELPRRLSLKEWLEGDIEMRVPKIWLIIGGFILLILIVMALD